VQVFSDPAGAVLAVVAEQDGEFFQQIRFRAEMTEVVVARGLRLRRGVQHRLPVVTVEGVPLDERRGDVLPPEDVLHGPGDRGGARAR
jgi:hypothetical protein